MSNPETSEEQTPEPAQSNTGTMFLHALVALCVVGAAIVGVNVLFSTSPKVAKRKRPPRRALLVKVAKAAPQPTDLQIQTSGLSMAAQRLEIIPQVQGRIATLLEDLIPGRIVKKGAVLASIERRDYQLAVARAQTAVAQANASLSLETGSQDLAELESKYLKDLVTDDNRDLVLRKPQLATAKASLAAAKVSLQQAYLDLSRTKILAPFDALVLTRDVAVGRTVTQQSSLASLAGIDSWWIRVEVPVNTLSQFKAGSKAKVALPSVWGEQTRTGTVMQPNGQVENQGRLGSLLVEVTDPMAKINSDDPAMLLGMRYEVVLTGKHVAKAIILEPGWIRGANEVWVMDENDSLAIKTVSIALRTSDRVIVDGGLEAGDRVITSRLASPVAGMELRLDDGKKTKAKRKGARTDTP